MAPSNVCNYSSTGEMIQLAFTAKSKLSISLLAFLLTLALAQFDTPSDPWEINCASKHIMHKSVLERNLKMVSNSLVENVNKTGYTISSHGQKGEEIYGLAQCRGDLNASTCRACVSNATNSLLEACSSSSSNSHLKSCFKYSLPIISETVRPCISISDSSSSSSIHLSGCFLRYDTHNFYTKLDLTSNTNFTWCNDVQSNYTYDGAPWKVATVLKTVMDNASFSNLSYSTLHDYGFYSLAQCWRDLSMNQCSQCLNTLYLTMGECPEGNSRGYALSNNCILRVANYMFYGDGVPLLSLPSGSGSGPSTQPSTGPSMATDEGKSHPHLPLMLGLSIGGVVSVLLLLGLVVIWRRKVINPLHLGYDKSFREHSIAISKSKLNYKFQTLQIATKKFNPTNKIGEGGFGSVYKGVLLDGREIAVKRLFANRKQSVRDFFNEVNLISRVQHKNLLNLLGFSMDGPDKFLVYEYLPNKSLDHFLYDENMGKLLDWQRRFEIILGTAGGLAYLHQDSDIRIIHRDIKASNILLDQHFKPKIADFGLVRYFGEDQTHLSTSIVGTRGYMAPEYLVHGQLTEKVDIYAFGVLVLEIISGRKNITPMQANDMPSLLTVIWNHYLSGTISNIIDPNIEKNCQEEVLQVVRVALLCTQASARLRPSMSKVIVFLTNKDPNLPAVTQPPFVDISHSESNTNGSFTANKSQSNNNTRAAPSSEMYHTILNIASSPATAMSLNTISNSSFGPR